MLRITPRHRIAVASGLALAVVALSATRAQAQCDGDCNNNGQVTVDEVYTGIVIALSDTGVDSCRAADASGDLRVVIAEILTAVLHSLEGCPIAYPRDNELRLNHFQVLGSHNSYHIRPDPPVLQELRNLSPALAALFEYDHPPLTEQFETRGIRQIELDVFADPEGGLYASPEGLRLTTGDPEARIPELEAPGLKVLHVQDIDYKTVCQTLIGCLQEVKAWSDTHPGHMPLMILIEAKDDVLPVIPPYEFVVPLPFGAAELDGIDVEIRSVFPEEQLITPDDVRGSHATLREAITTDGWPTLGEARGRVLFCLDNEGRRGTYLEGHPSLQGRVMFTAAPSDAPDTAFRKLNGSVGDFDEIQAAVRAGFIVRTRADADTQEARDNDTMTRDAAIASGAQWVSTDYPVPDPAFGTGYMVEIPGGMPARCNPLSAPVDCTAPDIENPAQVR